MAAWGTRSIDDVRFVKAHKVLLLELYRDDSLAVRIVVEFRTRFGDQWPVNVEENDDDEE